MNGFFFSKSITATADERLCNNTFKKLFYGMCFTDCEIEINRGKEHTFVIGDVPSPLLKDDKEYAVICNEKGVAVVGKDYGSLVRGIICFLMKLRYNDDGTLFAPSFCEDSRYTLSNRMIHICVFPENDLYFIKKTIRLACLCQYTHVVLEFWGMIRYDCLKELSWPHAFSKEEIKLLFDEIRELGMQAIPMFNHFGHATQSRVCYGKHVVLDQNPRLQNLFTPDGWGWDINSEKVLSLLKSVRHELYSLSPDSRYFHIGCDEAYYYTRCDELRKTVPAFLSKLTCDIVSEGRRPMLWMDMLLPEGKFKNCYATCKNGEEEKLISSLAKETVMVDWQYDVKLAPVESMMYLKETGYDILGAPWLNAENYKAVTKTAVDNSMFGIMLTTWHTLKQNMHGILGCAKNFGAASFPWSSFSSLPEETATLMRQVSFEGNSYADCGWSKKQIDI